MLLALASGNTYLDGETSSNGPIIYASPEIAAVAKQAFYDFGERPIWTERVTYGTAGEFLGMLYSVMKTYLFLIKQILKALPSSADAARGSHFILPAWYALFGRPN